MSISPVDAVSSISLPCLLYSNTLHNSVVDFNIEFVFFTSWEWESKTNNKGTLSHDARLQATLSVHVISNRKPWRYAFVCIRSTQGLADADRGIDFRKVIHPDEWVSRMPACLCVYE